ncbi:MAG: hypothetical protein EB103_06135 [Actinobacteria bacterium]|nr:hypothetical protein [Actinomycetota bacterium]
MFSVWAFAQESAAISKNSSRICASVLVSVGLGLLVGDALGPAHPAKANTKIASAEILFMITPSALRLSRV